MILEILTLVVLASVLFTKYVTATKTSSLNQREIEAENLRQRNNQRLNLVAQELRSAEAEIGLVQKERAVLESKIGELKYALEEQNSRNRELEDRMQKLSH